MSRRLPLSDYTDDRLNNGITGALALDPAFVSSMNLRRLEREGIIIALHYSPRYVRYTSDSGATYSVSDTACDCPAGLRGGVCRHRTAVGRAGGVEALRAALKARGR